jgi:two-component system chemotaxis family response regulator WspR
MESKMAEQMWTEGGQNIPPDAYAIVVLLVDDQAIVGEMVRRAMASQPDLSLHYCAEGSKALSMAELIHPTVILQDLMMPDADGLHLVQQYRASAVTKDVPVVVLSVKEEAAVKSDAFKKGANDYLVKLPDPVELVARIRYHSRAYLNLMQRDAAYRALHESQQQLVIMNRELQRLNNIDGLTGLANRRNLDSYLAVEWARAMREQHSLSLLMIDVDEFKRYNDTYGHLAGDEILKTVARAISTGAGRPTDMAARFGGEEFMVILPSTLLDGARNVAENIRSGLEALALPHHTATAATCVTISIGVATSIPQRDFKSTELVEAADAALYEAKRLGRNRIHST